jgi:mannose-6-phosphate isomerase-like protein (cupin superfamily)
MVNQPVDVAEKLSLFTEHWSPKVVARLGDYEIKVVKVKGQFVWHTHPETDELFLVIEGADGEVHAMLIEPAGVVNTGDAGGPMTATPDHSPV